MHMQKTIQPQLLEQHQPQEQAQHHEECREPQQPSSDQNSTMRSLSEIFRDHYNNAVKNGLEEEWLESFTLELLFSPQTSKTVREEFIKACRSATYEWDL